jgi:hypothetical protein
MTVRVKKSENGILVRFRRGQIVGARLAGASAIKTATLLGVSKATVSKVMSAYTNHGKATSAKRNCWRTSTLTEGDRRTLRRIDSKSHRTTTAQVTGQQSWIFTLKALFPQKQSDMSFTNPTSTVGLKLLNLWLPQVMLRCVNNGVTTIKLDIRQLETPAWYGQVSHPSRCSLHHAKFTFEKLPRKPTIRNA